MKGRIMGHPGIELPEKAYRNPQSYKTEGFSEPLLTDAQTIGLLKVVHALLVEAGRRKNV